MSSVLKSTAYLSSLQAGKQLRASQCLPEAHNSEVIRDIGIMTIQSRFGFFIKKKYENSWQNYTRKWLWLPFVVQEK